ncbi:hypothetical protein [Mycobacterium leprae]|uniref:hypothetical protein n=1 Tax=Mycobacterium leprae TaxID=1769 RepID=UPI0003191B31|nr:hypothetical protein [Mycobacterium leprae]
MHVQADHELDGLQMFELSRQIRVITITREVAPAQLDSGQDALLSAGNSVYLVDPYRK